METVFFYENKKTWKLYFFMKTRKHGNCIFL